MIVLLGAIFCSIYAHFAHWDIITTFTGIIIALVLFGSVYLGQLYYYRGLHVYVYTAGLIYWRRKIRRILRWEQIRRVDTFRGSLTLQVNNEPSLLLPAFLETDSALYSTFKRQVVSNQSSGQEADQRPVQQPATSPSE